MQPFFIVGPSRSGSTLLARMLDSHPAIAVMPETWMLSSLSRYNCLNEFKNKWQYIFFANELYESLKDYIDPIKDIIVKYFSTHPHYVGPTRSIINEIAKAYLQVRRAGIWGEKTPSHALRLPEMHTLFPEAQLICIIRDPRDILVSYTERWNKGKFETQFLMENAALIRYYFYSMMNRNPYQYHKARIYWVKYEDLVTYTEETITNICRFLSVPY